MQTELEAEQEKNVQLLLEISKLKVQPILDREAANEKVGPDVMNFPLR